MHASFPGTFSTTIVSFVRSFTVSSFLVTTTGGTVHILSLTIISTKSGSAFSFTLGQSSSSNSLGSSFFQLGLIFRKSSDHSTSPTTIYFKIGFF